MFTFKIKLKTNNNVIIVVISKWRKMEMIMDMDVELADHGPISKLKRKRSSEHLMLRKGKVFLQDLQYSPANEQPNDAMWSSNVYDVNMNISVSVNIPSQLPNRIN